MENLPPSDLILAGFFFQLCLSSFIRLYWAHGYHDRRHESSICKHDIIPWLVPIALSMVVAFFTTIKSESNNRSQRTWAFFGSFLLNLNANNLDSIILHCPRQECIKSLSHFARHDPQYELSQGVYKEITTYYLYFTIPITALAALLVMVRYLKRKTLHATGKNAHLPDPEIILLGVCIYLTAEKICHIRKGENDESDMMPKQCWRYGGSLIFVEFTAESFFLAVLTYLKTENRYKKFRSVNTLVGSFIIFLVMGSYTFLGKTTSNEVMVIVVFGISAASLTVNFFKASSISEPFPYPDHQGNESIQSVPAVIDPSSLRQTSRFPPSFDQFQSSDPSLSVRTHGTVFQVALDPSDPLQPACPSNIPQPVCPSPPSYRSLAAASPHPFHFESPPEYSEDPEGPPPAYSTVMNIGQNH